MDRVFSDRALGSPLVKAGVILAMLAISITLFEWLKSDPQVFRVASPENVNLILVLTVPGLDLRGDHTPSASTHFNPLFLNLFSFRT